MSYHIVPSVALGAEGQCVPVPYTSKGGGHGTGSMCRDIAWTCNCKLCTQQVLNDLGFGPVDVDGIFGLKTYAALAKAAESLDADYSGGNPGVALCKALVDKWTAPGGPGSVPPAAPPTEPPSRRPPPPAIWPGFLKKPAPFKFKMPVSPNGRPPPDEGVEDGGAGWWASQTDTTRYLIIGGAVVVLGAGAYFLLMPKKAAATPNPPIRRSKPSYKGGSRA